MNTANTSKNADKNADFLTRNGFQSLYLEYYAYLQNFEADEISALYRQGLKHNLVSSNFNPEVLRYIKKEVMEFAKAIKDRALTYKQALQQSTTHAASEIQKDLIRLLNQEIQESGKDQYQKSTAQQLINLRQKALDHLQIHPEDMLTEFNLAWMSFHLFEDYQAANTHFAKAVELSLLDDTSFTQLALRYQTMTYHFLNEKNNAISTILRASSLDQANDPYYLYEISQQLVRSGNKEAALTHLKSLIKKTPLYYIHAQSDHFFAETPEVDQLLARFHAAKLEAIKETTYKKWAASPIMQQTLPPEFDRQKLFNTNYDEHLPLLAHQPYPTLCNKEQISNRILKTLLNKTQVKLNSINEQFTHHIQVEQKKWKCINLLGVGLVYIAALLTLASIFLFIGSDLLGLTAKAGGIDWEHLIPRIFTAVLGTGILGVVLLQFDPPKLKKLAKKRSLLSKCY